eukprot:RCo040650
MEVLVEMMVVVVVVRGEATGEGRKTASVERVTQSSAAAGGRDLGGATGVPAMVEGRERGARGGGRGGAEEAEGGAIAAVEKVTTTLPPSGEGAAGRRDSLRGGAE